MSLWNPGKKPDQTAPEKSGEEDSLAVGVASFEPFSAEFPVQEENAGNFRCFGLAQAHPKGGFPANPRRTREIARMTEQGIGSPPLTC